ncbi:haloacid dehalogenase type II [Halorussus halophilus]|uniref:haloacid dehalogenase type II n=1 Tax=Halorussus halophilus TaxID=2650975 RepID=UPI0013012218|nr:haloacid dehalogenase type II [Halorussus halophilus]
MPERKALCFDMYGTLCDTSSVGATLGEELDLTESFAGDVTDLWRQKQLQYSYQTALMDAYIPFSEVTERAFEYALSFYDLDPSEASRNRVVAAYAHLDPFDDTVEALERLGEDHTVVVLSNGNPEMLETLAENAGLASHLDGIVSADEVQTFKPNPAVYENAAEQVDRDLSSCKLVSSNAWDVAGASRAGMATAWVNRAREPMETVGGAPDQTVSTLAELADELS